MSCHTWFFRPLTDEEFQWMKEWAINEINNWEDIGKKYKECSNMIPMDVIHLIKRSIETDKKCIYGHTWFELGWGCDSQKFIERDGIKPYVESINGKLYVDVSLSCKTIEKKYGKSLVEFSNSDIWKKIDFPYFHDEFRIKNYSQKIIHNKYELRKYLGKKYFKLTEWQLMRLSNFLNCILEELLLLDDKRGRKICRYIMIWERE